MENTHEKASIYEIREMVLSGDFPIEDQKSCYEDFNTAVFTYLNEEEDHENIMDIAEAAMLMAPDQDTAIASMANFTTLITTRFYVQSQEENYVFAKAPGTLNTDLAQLEADVECFRKTLRASSVQEFERNSDELLRRIQKLEEHCSEMIDYLTMPTLSENKDYNRIKSNPNTWEGYLIAAPMRDYADVAQLFYQYSENRLKKLTKIFRQACEVYEKKQTAPEQQKHETDAFDKVSAPGLSLLPDGLLGILEKSGWEKFNQLKPADPMTLDVIEKLIIIKKEDLLSILITSPSSLYRYLLAVKAIELTEEDTYQFVKPVGNYWLNELEKLRKFSAEIEVTKDGCRKARETAGYEMQLGEVRTHTRYLHILWDLLYDELRKGEYRDFAKQAKAILAFYDGLKAELVKVTIDIWITYLSGFDVDALADDEKKKNELLLYSKYLTSGLSLYSCGKLAGSGVIDPTICALLNNLCDVYSENKISDALGYYQKENRFEDLEKRIILFPSQEKTILDEMEQILQEKDAVCITTEFVGIKHVVGAEDKRIKKALDCVKDFDISGKTVEEFEKETGVNLSETHQILNDYIKCFTRLFSWIDSMGAGHPKTKYYFFHFADNCMMFSYYLNLKKVPLLDGSYPLLEVEYDTEAVKKYRKDGMPPKKDTKSSATTTTTTTSGNVSTTSRTTTNSSTATTNEKPNRSCLSVILIIVALVFLVKGLPLVKYYVNEYAKVSETRLDVKRNSEEYDFLMELQDSVIKRHELEQDETVAKEELVEAEKHLFELYDDTDFDTEGVQDLAKQYLRGLLLQEEALTLKYAAAQSKWQEGVTTCIQAVAELNERSKFGSKLKRNGIDVKDELKEAEYYWEAIDEVERELYDKFHEYNIYVYDEGGRLEYRDYTGYSIMLYMWFDFYDADGNLIQSSYVEKKIPKFNTRVFYVECPEEWYSYESHWDFEILSEPE